MRVLLFGLPALCLFLWPTWDALLGEYYIKKLCQQDGGVYLKPGVVIDSQYLPSGLGGIKLDKVTEKSLKSYQDDLDRYIDDLGTTTLEGDVKSGGYYRVYYDENNEFVFETSDQLHTRYLSHLETTSSGYHRGELVPGLYLTYSYISYTDRFTGETVASIKKYRFTSRNDLWLSGYGASMYCSTIYPDNPKYDSRTLSKMIKENNQAR